MQYTDSELTRLHQTLYEILAEVVRVCDKHNIHYFITGGTAIGAYFWKKILPWDDDIDIGMFRSDYEKFIEIAPKELGKDFFLQTPDSDPHVPFFFIKVRMNDTEFCESTFQHIDMHQGMYIDIFPFDKIPNHRFLEKLQHNILFFFNGLFIAKEIWQWKYCGHCDTETPRPRGFIPCLMTRLLITIFSKKNIFRIMQKTQMFFNGCERLTYCKNIITKNEKVLIDDILHPQTVQLGDLHVNAARDLLAYLTNHYGKVQKDIPAEMRTNHRPDHLKFKD